MTYILDWIESSKKMYVYLVLQNMTYLENVFANEIELR